MSALRFSVVACTSEDASFPVSALDDPVAKSQGYMTAANCIYPQELVLALPMGRCCVTQVHVLSHETHIATRMELLGSTSRLFDRQTTCFRRLGFFTLRSNTESKYMARELRTVRLYVDVTLLKLRIVNCYTNEHNVDRQVGIKAIKLYGEPLGPLLSSRSMDRAVAAQLTPTKKHGGKDEMRFDRRVDAKLAGRIREIQGAKEKAVEREDYDKAKQLKEMEEQVKSIGLQLARLEVQKRKALGNEDYDLAKKKTLEIRRLETSVKSTESQLILPLAIVASPQLKSKGVQCSSLNFSPRDVYPEASQVVASERVYRGDNASPRHSARGSYTSGNDQDLCSGSDDTDQEVGNDGGPNPHFTGILDAVNLPDPDEISAVLAKESEELMSVIGPFFTRCFYSSLWNHRNAAIRKVTMEMNNYPVEPIKLLEVCSKLVQSGIGDRIVPVTLSAFGLLDRMVSFGARICHGDMVQILDNCMAQLVDKLGGSQAKVRDEAVAVLGRLAAAENVGVAFVASHLTKRFKKPVRRRILQGRLDVLKKLLAESELVSESDFSAPGIMGFLEDSNSLTHQCREIRDAAKDIAVSLYRTLGAEVEGYLKKLRPKQLEEYQVAFEAAERAEVLNYCSGVTAATAGSGSVARYSEKRCEEVEDASDSDDEYACPFCGVADKEYDWDYLDQHFWGSCRMLTPCKMCGQVLEISTLTEHLLAECEMQQHHRECPRCGEAITTKFYERHVSLNDCPHRAPMDCANRCPLCHDDIAPGKKGWRFHLLNEGCPKNPRS